MKTTDSYLVAVSGGPDSTYLVHWLWNHGYRHLILAHVNYHWRKESDHDQKVVEALAQKFQIPLVIKNLAAHQDKPKHENFEAWARQQRYDFFSALSTKYHVPTLVVGHQKNDLIETFLIQQERQGLVNYYGLPSITTHHQLQIWRPLLQIEKSKIINWLQKNHIDYAIDKTNFDLRLQRNRLRNKLSEKDFAKLQQRIEFLNQKNQQQQQLVKAYLTNNQQANALRLTPELLQWSEEQRQRLIYLFFEAQKTPRNLLIGRKKNLVKEISKRLLKSTKTFWMIPLGSTFLIKDYDILRILSSHELPKSPVLLNSVTDFSKLEKFENKAQIIHAIKQHHHQFPYHILTLEPSQIKGQKWGSKSLQMLLSKQKISYEKRLKTGVIYALGAKKLLDFWQW